MHRTPLGLTIAALALAVLVSLAPARALPMSDGPAEIASPLAQPASDLLCGRGWHWSYFYLRCERNPHICPPGKFWISLLRVCV